MKVTTRVRSIKGEFEENVTILVFCNFSYKMYEEIKILYHFEELTII